MTPTDRELSRSFGAAATTYAEHRPDYAAAAIDWALANAPGPRVLDLGAGTGKLTAALAARKLRVIAVEPDPAMRTELERQVPGVEAKAGQAEAIPLPDGSVDAVLSGNAMHWFDPNTAGPEIARVLSPHGVLAGLWNLMDDRVDWVAGLAEVGGPEAIGARDTPSRWRGTVVGLHLPTDGSQPHFAAAEQQEFAHGQRRSVESLVATFSTKAGILLMSEAERGARLNRIRDYLAGRPETGAGEFTLPMVTGVLRTRRLG